MIGYGLVFILCFPYCAVMTSMSLFPMHTIVFVWWVSPSTPYSTLFTNYNALSSVIVRHCALYTVHCLCIPSCTYPTSPLSTSHTPTCYYYSQYCCCCMLLHWFPCFFPLTLICTYFHIWWWCSHCPTLSYPPTTPNHSSPSTVCLSIPYTCSIFPESVTIYGLYYPSTHWLFFSSPYSCP